VQGERTLHAGVHATDLTTDLALSVLNGTMIPEGAPWMLFVNHKAPHRNWVSPVRHLGYFGEREWPVPATFFDDFAGRTALQQSEQKIVDQFWSDDQKLFIGGELRDPGQGGTWGVLNPQIKFNSTLSRMTNEQWDAWQAFYDPITEVPLFSLYWSIHISFFSSFFFCRKLLDPPPIFVFYFDSVPFFVLRLSSMEARRRGTRSRSIFTSATCGNTCRAWWAWTKASGSSWIFWSSRFLPSKMPPSPKMPFPQIIRSSKSFSQH
jgi:hypothetical protein